MLVTGASGFLGSALVEQLVALGADVHALVRGQPQAPPRDATVWVADAADRDAVRAVFRQASPDVVYHLTSASQGGRDVELVPLTLRDDLIATIEVLLAALEAGVDRVVTTASLEEPIPSTGQHPVPNSPYSAAQWAASGYARMFHALYGLPVVGLRPFMTYGPGQKPHKLIPYVTLSLLRGEDPKIGSGARLVDWVYRDDVIHAFLDAALVPSAVGETIDLGSGEAVSIRDVVTDLFCIVGVAGDPPFGASADRPLEGIRIADVDHAERVLGWKASTPLLEGLRHTVDAFRLLESSY